MKSPLKVVCGMGFILVVMLAGISVCVQTDMETVCVEDGEPGLCERPSTAKMISVRTRRILGQARELEAANKLKEAVKLLKDTINPDPTQMVLNRREASMLHHALAVMNLKAGDFRRAHTETVSCINRDPAASDCYYLQGYIHAVRGEAALATEDFVEAWKKGLNWWLSYDIPKQCEGHRALFFDWMNSPGGRIKEIVYQDSPKLYGTPPTEACVPEKEGELCYIHKLTRFEERQTYMLRLKQHHLWGSGAYPTSPCHLILFGVGDLMLGRPTFNESASLRRVDGDLCLLNQRQGNHYHWTIEALSRLFALQQLHPTCHFVIMQKTPRILMHLRMFGVVEDDDAFDVSYSDYDESVPPEQQSARVLWYSPDHAYLPKRLFALDWRVDPSSIEAEECAASAFFPAPHALKGARDTILDSCRPLPEPQQYTIYCSRKDQPYRAVEAEEEFLSILREGLGGIPLVVHSSEDALSPIEEATLFHSAAVVLGPHGAGLSNAVFAVAGSVLMEFPTKSKLDAYYAHAAAATNLKYRAMPWLSSTIFGNYTIRAEQVARLAEVITQHWQELKK